MIDDSAGERPTGRSGFGADSKRDVDGPIVIDGGRVLTPEATYDGGRVVLSGDRIVRVDPTDDGGLRSGVDADGTGAVDTAVRITDRGAADSVLHIDAADRVVMPGLIDLHGDDLERELFPRPGAEVDSRIAIASADRSSVAAGVTTTFHAIAFEESPSEGRSVDLATDLVRRIDGAEGLVADNRIHARFEVADGRTGVVRRVIEECSVDLVSVMNHVPGEGQFDDDDAFRRRYAEGTVADAEEVLGMAAARGSVSAGERRDRLETVLATARERDVPVASHDDEHPADVERMADSGVAICEFPVTTAAARAAADRGLTIAMGAPNLVRGGSLWNNLGAADAIEEGLVDVLCSDYHPPSLLAAPFVDTGEPLHERAARVTANPAAAVGLDDRGRLESGARADVIVVDPDPVPTVDHAFVAGRHVLDAGPRRSVP